MKNRIFSLLILFLFSAFSICSAQEVLVGLQNNPMIKKESIKWKSLSQKNEIQVHTLPFYHDFSNYVGYPDSRYFTDRLAFVNNTYPIMPPTIGCATLDALDANGDIYSHASNEAFAADTLTSQPIRLDSLFAPNRAISISDSLYFSFYYQPAGGTFSYPYLQWERIGNEPESDDALILEFGYATGEIVFTGYSYCDYNVTQDFSIGDTLINPFFLPNTVYYIFESQAFIGEIISIPCDSLFGPEMIWNEVWNSDGASLDDWLDSDSTRLHYFKQVMIPINDAQYLRNNFQFRFRNYASLENNGISGWDSNVDQWHIDYIRLNVNRNNQDYYPNDLAFVSPTTSFLTKYQSMPWSQFQSSEMKSNFENQLTNLSQVIKNANYSYQVVKNHNQIIDTYSSYNENILPYFDNGIQANAPLHTDPIIDFNVAYDNADSAVYTITHTYVEDGNSGSILLVNDTVIYDQKFYNYYAYDDGTAESGYSLYSTLQAPETYFAMRFTLNQDDTLRAVRFWFNSTLNNSNIEPFTLKVWADDGNNRPGEELYSEAALLPEHAEDFLDFVTYYLETPIAISGTFYVGFYQSHNVQLNIGFDQNIDSREHFLYKTSTEWVEPFLKGTPMVRPVVGKYFDCVGIHENQSTFECSIYPNPVHSIVYLNLNTTDFSSRKFNYSIFDLYGKRVMHGMIEDTQIQINLNFLNSGLYILEVSDNQSKRILKIVKQ